MFFLPAVLQVTEFCTLQYFGWPAAISRAEAIFDGCASSGGVEASCITA
jgi:hypothetical protein